MGVNFFIKFIFCISIAICFPQEVFSQLLEGTYDRGVFYGKVYGHIQDTLLKQPWFKKDEGLSDIYMTEFLAEAMDMPQTIESGAKEHGFSDAHLRIIKNNFDIFINSKSFSEDVFLGHLMQYELAHPQLTLMIKNKNPSESESPFVKITIYGTSSTSDSLKLVDSYIRKHKATEVAIKDFNFATPQISIALSKYFKERDISIYVQGLCSTICSSYFLASGNRMSIGPYGLMFYSDFSPSLYRELIEAGKKHYEKSKADLQNSEEVEIFLVDYFNNSKAQGTLINFILEDEKYASLLSKVQSYVENTNKEFTNASLLEAFFSLSEEDKNLLY